jgi:hypothetical protein
LIPQDDIAGRRRAGNPGRHAQSNDALSGDATFDFRQTRPPALLENVSKRVQSSSGCATAGKERG